MSAPCRVGGAEAYSRCSPQRHLPARRHQTPAAGAQREALTADCLPHYSAAPQPMRRLPQSPYQRYQSRRPASKLPGLWLRATQAVPVQQRTERTRGLRQAAYPMKHAAVGAGTRQRHRRGPRSRQWPQQSASLGWPSSVFCLHPRHPPAGGIMGELPPIPCSHGGGGAH